MSNEFSHTNNTRTSVTLDGNEATAYVAHKLNEVIAIYPITPSSNMGEWADEWSSQGRKNLWGTIPHVIEMQSEGGAAGAVHGALQTGALSTTFTASQGLLLMIPNMFKIAGELTSTVFHISARTVATHALSIFGDHSDVMAVRSTGWAMLCSNSVQEAHDFALIAHAATLEARIPFVHFFDGFRTSHEVNKIEQLSDEDIRSMIDDELIRQHRERSLNPEHPVLRGSAQNPDVFFQARETVNPFYNACPSIVEKTMKKFFKQVGRKYSLFDYVGDENAERVIVMMGSGADTAEETVKYLNTFGEKVGILKVHLYRPFSIKHFINALPLSVKFVAVLDRTKEPGASGEPLYLDVVNALVESHSNGPFPLKHFPKIIGGRYGLSSKEFTPSMVKSVFHEMTKPKPKNHFTIGIVDDVTHTSLKYDTTFNIESDDTVRAIFYGLGADGTVSANKNSIKIIGEDTENFAQGYFVYDSKKSGSTTTSHLRFGPREIHAPYLIEKANFTACHQWFFLEKFDVLQNANENGVFLLNSIYDKETVWNKLPRHIQKNIIAKKIKLYVIDACKVATQTGMGGRINTIMQTCFFAISGVLPREQAIEAIKYSVKKTYGKKGEDIIQQNFLAIDQTLANLFEVNVPKNITSELEMPLVVSERAPKFVQDVTAKIIAGFGDMLPVSAFGSDGTFPTATAQWEKRNIAQEIPIWEKEICIQCNKCALVCPHAAIRIKVYGEDGLKNAPLQFQFVDYKGMEYKGQKYTVQVAPEDCTGCGICVDICPAKSKSETKVKAINMKPQPEHRERERANFDFFLQLSEADRRDVKMDTVKGSQFLQPLFEYSGACTGCGETPYVKLVTQMFGDRMIVANATGCSSIYGGNLPTTPWTTNSDGRGPAWSNSLFEDNAEFGLGMRLAIDKQAEMAQELVLKLANEIGEQLATEILNAKQNDEADIYEQRERVKILKEKLFQLINTRHPELVSGTDTKMLKQVQHDVVSSTKLLLSLADNLVKRSVWIMGGDGWAYDIGYGGLDHVLASGKNVNILVLDTEVYSNTGGQMSKSTFRSAVAKFAAAGKPNSKKDLAMIAMIYGNVYVAKIAMGANDTQTVKAIMEAEAYDGPSLIIAYSHCIAHGINMTKGMQNQKTAVDTGYWQLFRHNPMLAKDGKNPFHLDSKPPKLPLKEFLNLETRFKMLTKINPERSKQLALFAQEDVAMKWKMLEHLAEETENGIEETKAKVIGN
ncbi:MAG: pyruvate:ferredoxin (flavodoxin) oxidoreductase [Ignavibacteriales bacterium]|nr:pyruvate:ferredoxin (flavodoxin) oxidoreductase [Ignavibacteriales bacterium]